MSLRDDKSLLRLTQMGLELGTVSQMSDLSESFRSQNAAHLPAFISSEILTWFQGELARSEMVEGGKPGFYTELSLPPGNPLISYFTFLLNDSELLATIEGITGCAPLCRFTGRIFRREDASDHHDSWHDDVHQGRLVGLSINLGVEPFEGGEFRLKRADTNQALFSFRNTEPGDAVLFQISPDLRHMVSSVRGGTQRTVLAGWFRDAKSFKEDLFQPLPDSPELRTVPPLDKLALHRSVLIRNEREGCRVYCGRSDLSFGLNQSGKEILFALLEEGSLQGAVGSLVKKFETSEAVLQDSVAELIRGFAKRGLFD